MNKTKIDWPGLTHTWNPIVGCNNQCFYCYARKIAKRFPEKFPKDFIPTFYLERLKDKDLWNKKKHYKIFVGDMCDLFGSWIDKYDLDNILEVCFLNNQHEYMFLTKNPARYREFLFPDNTWLGTTITGQKTDEYNLQYLLEYPRENIKRFLSIEPLLGKVPEISPFVDLVIVGAMTGPGAIKPEKEWIDSVKHTNIYFKNNIKKYL